MLLALLLVDVAVRAWRPHPERLPEQFSPAYLSRIVADHRDDRNLVVFLGDSMLWGYGLRASDAMPSVLSPSLAPLRVLNLSYEGGSSANTYFMLSYLLAHGVRPALVVFNVNSKETNPDDSAYNRLQPSLERVVAPLIISSDRSRLNLQPPPTLSQQLDRAVEGVWMLYSLRTDLREACFGDADLASAALGWVQHLTGAQGRQKALHVPTPDKFLGTYDLEPLAKDNVDFYYLRKTSELVRSQHLRAVAFLTPTNHRLLADYINTPDYDRKLDTLAAAVRAEGVPILNLDRTIPAGDFIDNDHLTIQGNIRLAESILPALRRAVHDL